MAFIKAPHVTVTPNIGGATIPPARLSKNAGLSSLYERAYFCIASRVTLVVTGGYSRPTQAMFSGIDWLRFSFECFSAAVAILSRGRRCERTSTPAPDSARL